MKKTLLLLLAVLMSASTAQAGDLAALYLGANVPFYDVTAPFQSDIEGDFNGKISLSGHLSAVGSTAYGFVNNYWRSAVGGRVTTTDIENPNFSVGLGIQYRLYSLETLGVNEWAPDVSIGYRPWPRVKHLTKVIVGASAWYGLQSKEAAMELAARYQFKL